jgi:hypothetical protein
MVLILILSANPGANLNWLGVPPSVVVRSFSSASLKGPEKNFRTTTLEIIFSGVF